MPCMCVRAIVCVRVYDAWLHHRTTRRDNACNKTKQIARNAKHDETKAETKPTCKYVKCAGCAFNNISAQLTHPKKCWSCQRHMHYVTPVRDMMFFNEDLRTWIVWCSVLNIAKIDWILPRETISQQILHVIFYENFNFTGMWDFGSAQAWTLFHVFGFWFELNILFYYYYHYFRERTPIVPNDTHERAVKLKFASQ